MSRRCRCGLLPSRPARSISVDAPSPSAAPLPTGSGAPCSGQCRNDLLNRSWPPRGRIRDGGPDRRQFLLATGARCRAGIESWGGRTDRCCTQKSPWFVRPFDGASTSGQILQGGQHQESHRPRCPASSAPAALRGSSRTSPAPAARNRGCAEPEARRSLFRRARPGLRTRQEQFDESAGADRGMSALWSYPIGSPPC